MSALAELLPKTVDGLILSAPLVPPTLEGRKTVTRRMAKKWLRLKVGDLVFVRENWRTVKKFDSKTAAQIAEMARAAGYDPWGPIEYPAEGLRVNWQEFMPDEPGKLRPSIFLPRWASRCVLRITEKPRLELVQDITEEEAKREGVERGPACDEACTTPHRCGFIDTWRRLHTKPGERWSDNPSCVRIAFERAA
jgi:hypothetical protein